MKQNKTGEMSAFNQQVAAIAICAQANVPVVAEGPPGIGKSTVIAAIARSMEWPLETITLSSMAPEDLGGLPVLRDEGVVRDMPVWARRLSTEVIGGGRGMLFIDELTQAAPVMQGAGMRLVLDSVVGDGKLAPGVARVAAMNPTAEAAGGYNIAGPFSNRFCHLKFQMDTAHLSEAMLLGFPDPPVPTVAEDWQSLIPAKRALVSAFLRARPTLALDQPKDEAARGEAWPSPRTWEMAWKLMAASSTANVPEMVTGNLVAGCVGEGAGLEFLTYIRELDLPDPEAILKAPETLELPDRGDRQYAVLTSIAAAVLAKNTKGRWEKAIKVLSLAAKRCPDIASIVAVLLSKNRPSGAQSTDDFLQFEEILLASGLLK